MQIVEVSEPVMALCFAVLAGSIIVIVIVEEVPVKKADPFWPLLVGAVFYTALLLGTEALQKTGYGLNEERPQEAPTWTL